MNNATETKRHDGRNVKRIREILQVKQITLAHALGEDWNQKKISYLEDKEEIDDKLMEEIANALKVPVEAIRNFDEEKTIYNISCTFSDNAVNTLYEFNPIEKIVELYEALVKSEKEKNELLQRMLDERK